MNTEMPILDPKSIKKSQKLLQTVARSIFPLLGRGLEPNFGVGFSAIFHGVSPGISIRVENYGIGRKENCSQSTYKIFGCVFEYSKTRPNHPKTCQTKLLNPTPI
jgi:hypothetical protein